MRFGVQPVIMLNQDEEKRHSKAGDLLKFAGIWVGDDLEECLRSVYENRSSWYPEDETTRETPKTGDIKMGYNTEFSGEIRVTRQGADDLKITIALTPEQAEMYEEAIKDILSSDTFSTDCIGGWAKGIRCVTVEGEGRWLLLVEDEYVSASSETDAIRAFNDGQELPKGYHYFNRDTAEKVIAIGILNHGIGFLDGTTDANDLDSAIQQVILGEVVYC